MKNFGHGGLREENFRFEIGNFKRNAKDEDTERQAEV
jgi:hypothetical protein